MCRNNCPLIILVSPRFIIFFFPEDRIASTTVDPDLGKSDYKNWFYNFLNFHLFS